jgi:nitroreductase
MVKLKKGVDYMIMKSIKDRRSVRKYKETAVERATIEALLEAAMLAPSACNSRPWRFVVVTQRAILDKLADCHKFAKMLHKAPVAIVMVALAGEQARNKIAEGFWPQDCGAATQNILLQAQEMGLASCWCGAYPKEPITTAVRGILALPEDEIPFNIIAIGYGNEEPDARGFYEPAKVRWVE